MEHLHEPSLCVNVHCYILLSLCHGSGSILITSFNPHNHSVSISSLWKWRLGEPGTLSSITAGLRSEPRVGGQLAVALVLVLRAQCLGKRWGRRGRAVFRRLGGEGGPWG